MFGKPASKSCFHIPHFTFKKVQDSKGLHWYPWPHHGASCEQLCWCRFAPPLPFSLGRCICNSENPPSPRYLALSISVIYSPAPMYAAQTTGRTGGGRVWEKRRDEMLENLRSWQQQQRFSNGIVYGDGVCERQREGEKEQAREEMIMTRCQIEI